MAARSLNKVILIGNLTRDPELRYTPQGTAVCTIGLATNRSWTPTDGGDRQEETEFHRIVAWAKLAEICSQLLHKGRKVYVEGRLQTRKWQTSDGQDRETTEVVISDMIALGPPKGGTGSYNDGDSSDNQAATADDSGSPQQPAADDKGKSPTKTAAKTESKPKEEVPADDIPF